jgi:hypothetical protein
VVAGKDGIRGKTGWLSEQDSNLSRQQYRRRKSLLYARADIFGLEQKLIVGGDLSTPHLADVTLLTAIGRAHVWIEELKAGRVRDLNEIAHRHGLPSSYVRAHLPLAFLAPSIISAILEGRQPADLSLKNLMYRTNLALDWAQQRRQLGFDP